MRYNQHRYITSEGNLPLLRSLLHYNQILCEMFSSCFRFGKYKSYGCHPSIWMPVAAGYELSFSIFPKIQAPVCHRFNCLLSVFFFTFFINIKFIMKGILEFNYWK